MKTCVIENCNKKIVARNMCGAHYQRVKKYGSADAIFLERRPNGTGGFQQGYFTITEDGRRVKKAVYAAEKVLGKRLPDCAVVHHVDGDKANDLNSNLVICQNNSYHIMLHQREKSIKNCGHANWYQCRFCKKYGPIGEITRSIQGHSFHRSCRNEFLKIKRQKENASKGA